VGSRNARENNKEVYDKHQPIYDKCVEISKKAGQNPARSRRAPPGPSWPSSQTSPYGQNGMPMIYGQAYWPSYGGPMYGRLIYGYPPGGGWSPYQFYNNQPPILPIPYFYG